MRIAFSESREKSRQLDLRGKRHAPRTKGLRLRLSTVARGTAPDLRKIFRSGYDAKIPMGKEKKGEGALRYIRS